MKKLLIYPFTRDYCAAGRYKALIPGCEAVVLVSPQGWGFEGMNLAAIDGGADTTVQVQSDFSESLSRCDTVLFTDAPAGFQENLFLKTDEAVAAGKNILINFNINHEYEKKIKEACLARGKSYNNLTDPAIKISEPADKARFYYLQVPVVMIAGVSERTGKFQLQLALKERLCQLGYKVSVVASNSAGGLLGCTPFPFALFNSALSEEKKVLAFNHFLKALEEAEKPDVLLLGIPGGLFPFNETLTNHFGITALLISLAVQPDYVILSTLYEKYPPAFFTNLAKQVVRRFGWEIDLFNLANTVLDWKKSNNDQELVFSRIRHNLVEKALPALNRLPFPIINSWNEAHIQKATHCIIEKLSGYAAAQIV